MKKKVFIILGIVAIVLVVAALVTSYADSARVRNSVEPVHTIKIVSKDGNKVTYWGLGYKVIRYPSVSPNEPYKNNRGVKYGSWFMDYEAPVEENSHNRVWHTDLREFMCKFMKLLMTQKRQRLLYPGTMKPSILLHMEICMVSSDWKMVSGLIVLSMKMFLH